MSEKLIKPYEISVWEDNLIQVPNTEPAQYKFEEKKLAVIGSDTMTGLNKVYNPVFHKKANGERTLSFSMKYKYFDPYSGNEGIVNPFVALLTNERKVKLHYDNEWYEFIVKEHTEASEEYEWTYTCTDAFVLELSKNGYNLTFDNELNNNQGTAAELAEKVLEDTDWQLGQPDLFRQLVDEPIYLAELVTDSGIEIINATGDETEVPTAPCDIYLFYTYVKNKNGKYVQFIIRDNQYIIDDNNVITNTNYRIETELEYKVVNNEAGFYLNNILIISIGNIETKYQAYRLVYNQLTTYDPVMQRTVDRFGITGEDREVYRYIDYVYTTSNVVLNYITNGDNFNVLEDGTLQGWNPYVEYTGSDERVDKLELVTKPELGPGKILADLSTLSEIEGFLKVKFKNVFTAGKNAVYNSGIENNTSSIQSISQGDKFVFRWRAGQRDPNEVDETVSDIDCLVASSNLKAIVAKYTQDEPNRWSYYYKHIDMDDIVVQFTGTPEPLNNIIRGGTIEEAERDSQDDPIKYIYVIDTVVQNPSTKYIYVNSNDNKNYVWNGLEGTFEELEQDYSNYLQYYYLIAEAQKAVPNSVLKDPTQKYGLFIYTDDAESSQKPFYIQDIQFTRYIEDAEGQPIIMGNVPTATSTETEYYYFQPADDMAADEVTMYTSLEELKTSEGISADVIPLYNENSEKNLTISASKSNCFDILQTIAETFECWIELYVEHDPNTGYIVYEGGVPQKYVYLREYAGDKQWAGFKYGVNLQSIEREINSNEFVTKLIVDQSQSEYVDEGYVSIASAPSNTNGESYILNFDYYYNQGLLNKEEAEVDRLQFISNVATINNELQEKEKQRRDLEASMTALGSQRNVYTELINTAKETKTQSLMEFEDLTNRTYDEYREQQDDAVIYDDDYYVPTNDTTVEDGKIYYTYDQATEEIAPVENPTGDPNAQGWYELLMDLTEEETVLDLIGQIYVASATINNYSGILTNIEQEYWNVRHQLRGFESYSVKIWTGTDDLEQRHVFVELNDYLPGFSFTLGGETYESTVSIKYFDITTTATEIVFTVPSHYTISAPGSTYVVVDEEVATFTIDPDETIDGLEAEIKRIQEDKNDIVKAFNNKYSRFIQEGTWNSTDYIDSELYYLDALQVSNTSAQPTVSYTINVVEISQLEGFEWYLFDAGDKSYVEDTEFFGWANVNGVLTPAREEVIVSEVEWHLEEPDKNVITVQNYKTRFEDFFQRISATVQTVQYNEATYAKISSLVDANGVINQDVLLQSMNNLAGQEYALTSDGSIIIDNDVILIQNLTNPANRVIINSEGIRVSSDGGNNYTTAIDGQGINIGAVYTGTLNTNEVIIGSRDNPSFRWDKAGISAFKFDGSDESVPYDLQTFVRFDQYGLYGIKDNGSFKAESLSDIIDKAHFAVTWDGFFIKNSYEDGGRVSITSDNDFQVIDGTNTERIKIGSLGVDQVTGNRIYGINISDSSGNSVLNTNNDGDLTITGIINATGGNFSDLVYVGKDETDNSKPYIIIDGRKTVNNQPHKATISSSNYNGGPSASATQGWIINSDGDAIFNNITARGSIKTAVFEYAEIQAVGGVFIFRPSSAIRSAAIDGNNLVVTVEKPMLFKADQWCKVSNYTADGEADNPDSINILNNNGLAHVYKVSRTQGSNNITLLGAAAMVSGVNAVCSVDDLIGGSLVDMGNKTGTANYGIGINSSDNTVNLPARAISLFETVVDETQEPKVTYNYRGILGTLPPAANMVGLVNSTIYNNMANTQGIYTDNMYIGDASRFLAFYTENNQKKLRIKASDIIFEGADGTDVDTKDSMIEVVITSSNGNIFKNNQGSTVLTCTVLQGNNDITSSVSSYIWKKDGVVISEETTRTLTVNATNVDATAVYTCDITLTS